MTPIVTHKTRNNLYTHIVSDFTMHPRVSGIWQEIFQNSFATLLMRQYCGKNNLLRATLGHLKTSIRNVWFANADHTLLIYIAELKLVYMKILCNICIQHFPSRFIGKCYN